MKFMPWLFALLSTAICLYLWFWEVRRLMRVRLSTVESAAGQLLSCRKKAAEDPELTEVLARSESIYQQGLDLYHDTLSKLWVRLPAQMMGFAFLQREVYLQELDDRSAGVTHSAPKVQKKNSGLKQSNYWGSVRFFKNLILLTVIILILIPTLLAIRFGSDLRKADADLKKSETSVADLRTVLGNLVLREDELKRELNTLNTTHGNEISSLRTQLQAAEAKLQNSEPESENSSTIQVESPCSHLYPDFYAPQELNATLREHNVIYLTFDDGPSARTAEILDVLKEKNVKATFFVVGTTDQKSHDLLRRIVAEGHTLGMHTYSHLYSEIYKSVENYLADMYQIYLQIKDVTGVAPTLFRFPGGSINGYNSAIYQELVAEMMRRGFVPFDWNLSNSDASEKLLPAETLVDNVVLGAKNVDRGVVLMHDSAPRTTTVEALGTIIDRLREMGFELKALTPDVMPLLYAYKN